MSKCGKIRSAKVTKSLTAVITGFNPVAAAKTEFDRTRYSIETKAGTMTLCVDCPPDSSLLTVFGRFEDTSKIKLAQSILGERAVSMVGKCNFHYNASDEGAAAIVNDLTNALTKLTIN